MKERGWLAEIYHSATYWTIGIKEYLDLVTLAQNLNDICFHLKHPILNDSSEGLNLLSHNWWVGEKFGRWFRSTILQEDEGLHENIICFQQLMLEYFSELYHAVSEYMWMPLLAKDEINSNELYLASVEIF